MSESLEPERNPGSDCGGEALVDQQATCPAPSDLLSFLEDGLDEPTASRIVQHVDTCLKCQETLAEISGELELHGPEPIPFFLRRLSERDPDALNDDDWVDHFFDGDTTIGSYRIDKEIGRGAMGIVFRGIDRELDRPVAIKVLRPSLSATESFRSRFLRESQVMAKIDHPNVVPVYDVGQHEGVPFVAMKLLQGESLRERLRRVGSLDNDSLEELAIQAATGLEAVHREGLVHRDIKPANLFLEAPNDRVRLLDFGLASQRDSAQVTQVGTLLGSPAYMSPEQARGETVDARSDLFSLGSTLYEAASGNLPFAADSTIGVITQLVSQDPVPIREQAPAISARLAKQINLLLEKAPKRRPASAKSVRTALEATTGLVLPPRLLKVLVGVAFVTILAAVVVFRLKTPHGELTVEFADGVDPKNIAIEATSGGEVKLLNAEQGWTIRVSNGEYNVRLSNGSDRFELNKDSITVFNTEKQYLKVRLKKLVAPAPQSARDVAAWVLSVGGEVTTTAPGAKSLSELEQLPERVDGIEVIDLRGTDIGDDDVRRLTSLATLQSLCLGSTSGGRTRLSGKALSILDRTPELVDLQLSGIIMDGETLQQIGSTTSLKSLSIKDGMVADDDLTHFARLEGLTKLELMTRTKEKGVFTGKGLRYLEHCELESLTLADSTLLGEAIVAMPTWETLRLLSLNPLYRHGWSNEAIESLARFPQLRDLRLHQVKLEDSSALLRLPVYTDLETLLVSSTKAVDDAVVEHWVSALPNLEVLSVANTSVTDASLDRIAAIPKLRVLMLMEGSALCDAANQRFKHLKPECTIKRMQWKVAR